MKDKMLSYAIEKALWVRMHPNATPQEYDRFIFSLCRRLGL